VKDGFIPSLKEAARCSTSPQNGHINLTLGGTAEKG